MSWDDFGDWGDWDLLDSLANIGFDAGDLGDLFLDTETGQFIDPSMVDPADLIGDFGGLPEANVPGGPTGTSLSDQLRSREVDPYTEGSEDFDWAAMADPSASIASADDGWAKAIAQGLGSALGGLGKGLTGLGGLPVGDGGLGGLGGGAGGGLGGGGGSVPGLQGPVDVPGLPGLIRAGQQEPLGAERVRGQADAALASLTPAQRAALGMTPPIDRGPDPVKFTPLQIPTASGAPVPMAGVAPAPRLSGLQRLISERLG